LIIRHMRVQLHQHHWGTTVVLLLHMTEKIHGTK